MKLKNLLSTCPSEKSLLVRPFIIAEAGVNHEGSMNSAMRLIDEAKEGGADAIKFQTYRAASIAIKKSPAYWDLTKEPIDSQYELFKKYDKFWRDEFIKLKNHCDKTEIEFLSTPFDLESAYFLNDLMDVFKVSSSDITNKPFIEYICDFGKPIILSTGASNLDEVKEATKWISSKGNQFALLHCILNYPTQNEDANLAMILDLKTNFPKHIIGYSDHTLPGDMKNLEVATLLGASIIEKHFTLNKNLSGNDHYHAMDTEDLKKFKTNLDNLFQLLGNYDKCSIDAEQPARTSARRSLVAKREINLGEKICFEDITWKRPGTGISPKDIQKALKCRAAKYIAQDSTIQWSDLTKD
jgi:sialic acid synthase SpsE